ncbi:hypothetical protein ACLESD_30435 [Pyxidicoccus sp. 3LFB2]
MSSPTSPESSEPASDGRNLGLRLLQGGLTSHLGSRPGVSGAALKPGGGHSDNCQTASHELKPDGFDTGVQLPGKVSPIKIGSGHADNISKEPRGDAFKPPEKDTGSASERTSFLGGIGKLLQRLFPNFPWGQVMHRGNKPGGGHSDNVLMNSHPGRDRGIQ